jgi:hypothetical protein
MLAGCPACGCHSVCGLSFDGADAEALAKCLFEFNSLSYNHLLFSLGGFLSQNSRGYSPLGLWSVLGSSLSHLGTVSLLPTCLPPLPLLPQPQLKEFKTGLAVFLRRMFGPWIAVKEPGAASGLSDAQLAALLSRLQAAERALGTSVS